MSKINTSANSVFATISPDPAQRWSSVERENWVSMAIAAATASLREMGFNSTDDDNSRDD